MTIPHGESVSSVERIHLLAPEDLPHGWSAFPRPTQRAHRAIAAVLAARSEAVKLHRLQDVLDATCPRWIEAVGHDWSAPDRAATCEHDSYFRVVRVRGDTPDIFIHGVARVYRGLLADLACARSDLPPEGRACLHAALDLILGAATGQPTRAGRAVTFTTPPPDAPPPAALQRWVRGHQLFLTIIQGLIVACHALSAACSTGIGVALDQALDRALDRLADLLRGATFAFRFTADFSSVDYTGLVRPSMMPPVAPAGMIGLHLSDHAFFLQFLSTMKPLFGTLDGARMPAYRRFRDAFAGAYDAHRSVCSRLTGADQPSLLSASRSEMPAVEILNRFKRARLAMMPASP